MYNNVLNLFFKLIKISKIKFQVPLFSDYSDRSIYSNDTNPR